jgi:hypothetical protein
LVGRRGVDVDQIGFLLARGLLHRSGAFLERTLSLSDAGDRERQHRDQRDKYSFHVLLSSLARDLI